MSPALHPSHSQVTLRRAAVAGLAVLAALAGGAGQARALAALSPEQLADVGLDRSAPLPAKPIFEVEAGLIANLTAMR